MALETGTYISDLVATNPVGATDPKSQGDDHIRLLKSTIKATFPNLSGAMTLTHGNLNALAPFFTDPNADRIAFWDDSAGAFAFLAPDGTSIAISNTTLATGPNVPLLNAGNTFTATQMVQNSVPEFRLNRLTGTAANWELYIGTGSTDLRFYSSSDVIAFSAAGKITCADLTVNSVAYTDFARLSQANTFTGSTAGGRIHEFINTNTGSTSYADVLSSNGTRSARLTMLSTGYSGAFFGAGPSGEHAALWTDGNIPFVFGTASEARFWIDGSGNFNFKSGTVTTSNASASEVGYKGAPSTDISASTNTAAATAGTCIRLTGGSGQTYTLDSDPPEDSVVVIDNASGNSWTIAASGTLTWAVTGGTGSRTLANGGMAVALHQGSGNWKITGGGLS